MLTGSLNAASVSAVLSAIVGLLEAACAYPLGRAPDWEDLRPLTWVGLSAALVAASNAGATLDLPPAATSWMGRLQVAGLSLHVLAWLRYLPGWSRRSAPLLRRTVWPLPIVAALALVPGVVYGRGIALRPVAWLGVTYHQPVVTWGGVAAWAILGGYAAWGMALVLRWGRAGAPYPRAHLACTGALFVMGLHDGAVAMGMRSPAPCLLDFLCYLPVSLFGVATLRRVSESATEYHHLRSSLESAVADRSRELEESRAALARAERLAALGQFSAGVAHEVNNPAAAVSANLQYLAGELAGDEREEVLRSLDDARAGVQRIVRLASQLLLAGRTASGAGRRLSAVSLARVIEPAMASARARAGTHAALSVELPPGVWVKAHQEPLVQVLTNLIVNALQAIPASRPGEVVVRAEVRGERVDLVVEDDGVGMSEDELRHVFEPFYSTKPPGMGTGLGLAVARDLVKAMQGDLRFESAVGTGTRAILELARAGEPDTSIEEAPTPPPAPRAAILVIDDDEQVLRSMARLLGSKHEVRVAPGVQEGLAAVAERVPDLVLCDVMMPGGGGERFWAELLLRAPGSVDRVAFMTGGAVTREAREFLRRQPRPILTKPFDLSAVDEILNRDVLAGREPTPAGGVKAPALDRRDGEGSPAT